MRPSNIFLLLSICLVFLLTACKNEKFDSTKILGAWKVNTWKIEKTGKLVPNKMDMDFGNDGLYSIDYGPKEESGKYWIAGEFLHTVETNKSEKTVKIIKLQSDTMEIQMNRGGQLEQVILVKRN